MRTPHRRGHSRERFIVLLVIGVAVAATAAWLWNPLYAPMCAWAACCLVYLAMVWARVWPLDGQETAAHATREDPGRGVVDLLLLLCAVAAAADLVFVLAVSRNSASGQSRAVALLGLASIVLSWALVQTLFTLRYAHLYHLLGGGIDFNQPGYQPSYRDFAYLSFNLGMTFQVSDTTVSHPVIRATVLRHTLLAYMFSTLLLADVINVVVGILP